MVRTAGILLLATFFSLLSFSQKAPENPLPDKSQPVVLDPQFMDSIPDAAVPIDKIHLNGNKVTHPSVIFREMLLLEGDTVASVMLYPLAEQSRKNLLNTSLFNFVNIQIDRDIQGKAVITLHLVERWYLWPVPIFEIAERNFNEWWENKDLARANYGAYITWENFRGRRERISFLARAGYNQRYSISYNIPYLNKNKTLGMGFSAGMNRGREVNYLTFENKQLFLKDPNEFLRQEWFANIRVSYRKGIHNTHTAFVNFNQFEFADTILKLNSLFTPKGENNFPYFSLFYEFQSDYRDIKAYPLKGYYWDFSATKMGLGLLQNEHINTLYFTGNYRRYWELSSRNHFAAGLVFKYSPITQQPYFMQQGLGFRRNMVRGYEYYVIDGQSFAVLKSNYKRTLVPQRSGRLPGLSNQKFALIHYAVYLNLFADAGYVSDIRYFENNPLANSLLFGTGAGIDLVTFYDKVFRFELSFNRKLEPGFYVHMIAPI